jgi:hypothetical protein
MREANQSPECGKEHGPDGPIGTVGPERGYMQQDNRKRHCLLFISVEPYWYNHWI